MFKIPLSYPYEYVQEPAQVNWGMVIIIFAGILTIIVLVTIFFVIPEYVRGYLNESVQGRIGNLSNNAVDSGCSSDVYNCWNFTTQQEAQDVFEWCIGQGVGDVHHLDTDKDGKACDSLE